MTTTLSIREGFREKSAYYRDLRASRTFKQAMKDLNASDPVRWTTTALAKLFSKDQANMWWMINDDLRQEFDRNRKALREERRRTLRNAGARHRQKIRIENLRDRKPEVWALECDSRFVAAMRQHHPIEEVQIQRKNPVVEVVIW